MRILISLSSFGRYDQVPLKRLKDIGCEVITNPYGRRLSESESMVMYTDDIDGVIAGTETISKALLDHAKSLKVISRCGSGLDSVDVKAAEERNIAVLITSDGVVEAVAELTLGLMLSCLRSIAFVDRSLRNDQWVKSMGYLLNGKTLGLIGVGRIGRRVAELSKSFGVRLIGYDLHQDKIFSGRIGLEYKPIKDIMRESDVVSLHLPLTLATKHIIDSKNLALLKKDAFLVNAARGGLVDERALYECLVYNRIAGAALDVYEDEPYMGPLRDLNNVVLTSHIGSYARESRIAIECEAVDNMLRALKMTEVKR